LNKTNNFFSPVNVFKFVIMVSIMIISLYGLFINTNAIITSVLIIQLLLASLLIISGVQGLKDENKENKRMAYTYLIVAIIVLILTIVTFAKILQ